VAPAVEVDPEKEARGREVAARMTEALGGADRIAALRSVRSSADVSISTPGGELTAQASTVYGVPDRMRTELAMFGQTQIRVVSPDGVWRTQQGAVVDLEGDDAKETRQDAERAMFFLAWAASRDDWLLQDRGVEEGRHLVQVTGPSGGSFTAYVDEESGLPVRAEYDGPHPMTGQAAHFVEEFSDFRSVDGVRRPHRIVTIVDDEPFLDAKITELVIDGDVPADAFVRPAG